MKGVDEGVNECSFAEFLSLKHFHENEPDRFNKACANLIPKFDYIKEVTDCILEAQRIRWVPAHETLQEQPTVDESVMQAHISLIPKVVGELSPGKMRPITVLSVLYRAWVRARLQDMMDWQEFVFWLEIYFGS